MEEFETHGSMYSSVGSQTSAVVEELGVLNGGESQASLARQDTIDTDAPSAYESSSLEYVSEILPTIEHDPDSSSSEYSAVTALESQRRQ